MISDIRVEQSDSLTYPCSSLVAPLIRIEGRICLFKMSELLDLKSEREIAGPGEAAQNGCVLMLNWFRWIRSDRVL